MLWLAKQFLSDLSEICVMNFLFSVHSLWLFHFIIPFLQLSYFPIDQWFTNLTVFKVQTSYIVKDTSIYYVFFVTRQLVSIQDGEVAFQGITPSFFERLEKLGSFLDGK